MPRLSRVAAVLSTLVFALAAPRAAAADPDPSESSESAEELAARGFDAYDGGEYETAVALFEAAYALAPVDGLLYNIAQAHRQRGEQGCAQALGYFRRYLTAVTADGTRAPKRLLTLIAELDTCVERIAREGKPAAVDLNVIEPAASGEDPAIAMQPTSRPRRTAGWIVLAGGAAAITTATVTGVLAFNRKSDLSELCNDGVCAPSLASDIRGYSRLRTTSFVAGGVGVAALVAGGWLLLRSESIEGARAAGGGQANRSLEPWFGPRSVGIACAF